MVKVKFDSFDKLILNEINKEIEISVRSVPIKGEANKEIIRKISKYFNVKTDNVRIVHGLYSNIKVIDIFLK
ncbi:MAG: DUF167 domain-containing protein [Nitrosopumilus sp.]|nr:DUF167 domain-containing protein [Nitrosopumilus sp.]